MLLSTQTHALSDAFGDEKAIRILAENGYDAADYSMFGMERPDHFLNTPESEAHIKNLRRVAGEIGIVFNQSHAPFPSYIPGREDYNSHMSKALRRSIEITAALGAKIVIIHPITLPDSDAQREANIRLYEDLRPVLREYKVRAALENMFGGRDNATGRLTLAACSDVLQFNEYLDLLGYDEFTACLDLGHCGLVGFNAADMIRGLGHDRLGALHVHDNNFADDLHTLPYLHKLDWPQICAALREINYAGEFTLEADSFIFRFPDALKPAASRFMSQVGHALTATIEE
jgi:L-ribulose-5-phosphate 3-epimerase